MLKKNLLFCVLMGQAAYAASSWAVEMIRPEDESLIWEVRTEQGNTAHGVINQMTNGGGEEEIIYVVPQENLKPFRGAGLQSIPVPENINRKARAYVPAYNAPSTADMRVRPDTPRSMMYPIGAEREEADAWKNEWFDPNFNKLSGDDKVMQAHDKRVQAYLKRINNCKDSKAERIDMEMAMLDNREFAKNAAYVSQTMESIEQCYDDLGMEIIERLYDDDNDVLRRYNKDVEQFRVRSAAPSFDSRYCEGGVCSFSAVAMLQLEKFDDFRAYLSRLVMDAPITQEITDPTLNEEEPLPWEDDGDAVMVDDDGIPYVDEDDL